MESNVHVTNTCTIDYLLFALWYAYTISPSFKNSLSEDRFSFLIEVFNHIDKKDWLNARKVWIFNVLKTIPLYLNEKDEIEHRKTLPLEKKITIDFFGSEDEYIITYIAPLLQQYRLKEYCSSTCSRNGKEFKNQYDIFLYYDDINNICQVGFNYNNLTHVCLKCKSKTTEEIQFINDPYFLFIHGQTLTFDKVSKTIEINNINFELLCATHLQGNHFKCIYKIKEKYYLINDIGRSIIEVKSASIYSCSTCCYIRKDK
jgi:hypothetical protein